MATDEYREVPQIQDIVPNHDGGRPELVADLEGRAFELVSPQRRIQVELGAAGRLMWRDGTTATQQRIETLRVRPGIYFLDWVDRFEPQRSSTLILDLTSQRSLLIEVTAPGKEVPPAVLDRMRLRGSQSAVDVSYTQFGMDGPLSAPFPRTAELVGKACRFHYSDTHVYDHIYLSERYHAWFCRSGPDAGLGDFDECDYFGIAHGLVVFSWREKLIPCVGIAVEDHVCMRSVGKIFGAHAESGATANVTVGAHISELATIRADVAPPRADHSS